MNAEGFQECVDTVFAIDLNNVHRKDVNSAHVVAKRINGLIGPAYVAFLHFYYMDNANAQFHVADVRFSPVTFRLAEALEGLVNDPGEIEEVMAHRGHYEEDPGR